MASVPGLQEQFLNALRLEAAAVTVFLHKGIRLQGQVSGYDNYSLTLSRSGEEQLVYKQSITTILTAKAKLPDLSPAPTRGDRQDAFLRARHGKPVSIYLVNGVALEGDLLSHDAYCLLLANDDGKQLVFKHGVATVRDRGAQ